MLTVRAFLPETALHLQQMVQFFFCSLKRSENLNNFKKYILYMRIRWQIMRFNCIFKFCYEDKARTHRFSFSHAFA